MLRLLANLRLNFRVKAKLRPVQPTAGPSILRARQDVSAAHAGNPCTPSAPTQRQELDFSISSGRPMTANLAFILITYN